MQRFRNWLISKLLEKDKLVAVPEKWQIDYVKMAGDVAESNTAIRDIMHAYNDLLREYYEKCSVKELKGFCTAENIKFKQDTPKEILVNLLVEEFKMAFEKK